MKLGLIARADNSGLGIQTFEFYRHMQPAKTLVVDISMLNRNKIYPEKYPDARVIHGFPTKGDLEAFLDGLDCVFVAEAPYNFELYTLARERGIKTAVQYNYEFFDWFANPELPRPDLLIAPSLWHYAEIDQFCQANQIQHAYIHSPVARDKLPFRQINQAREFLHVVGRAASHDRNGTKTVINAALHTRTPAKIIIHFQGEQGLPHQTTHTIEDYREMIEAVDSPNLIMQQSDFENYEDIYKRGDVLLLPRRYGGNCLPMNEALSVGMPAIMTDIEPNKRFLPHHWLIPAGKIGEFSPRTVIDIFEADPRHLAKAIDRFYRMTEAEFLNENARASNLAESISWDSLKWRYQHRLEELCSRS